MLETFLPSLPMLVLTIAVLGGGLWVFKRSYIKQLGELQQSATNTYKSLSEAQEKQIKLLEKKVTHLNRVMLTVEYALKRRGLRIEINDESITLIDEQSRTNQTVQIRMMEAAPLEEDKEA